MAFRIRAEQMAEFERTGMAAFEDEMVAHSKEFSPRLCKVLSDDQLRVALRQAIQRAQSYGFTNRGPIRLYIELMFLCGSNFDTDPQYTEIRKVLDDRVDQMAKANRICEGVVDYNNNVAGKNNLNVRNAEEYLAEFARSPIRFSEGGFEGEMIHEFTKAYPQKVEYVGPDNLHQLIKEGREEARKYEMTSLRAQALIVILKFAFGHGCTNDPLYPWINRTLVDDKIQNPDSRAKRLEKKSITWLEHVLAGSKPGVPN